MQFDVIKSVSIKYSLAFNWYRIAEHRGKLRVNDARATSVSLSTQCKSIHNSYTCVALCYHLAMTYQINSFL